MNFKNILKLSSALLLATPSLANFGRDCADLNDELVANTKLYLRDDEALEDFPPIKECDYAKNGEITDLYLVSKRIDQSAVEQALSHDSIENLTYFLDNVFYQRKPAVYDEFPTSIGKLSNLKELTLKYNERIFDHGVYYYGEKEINKDVLKFSSNQLKVLTLDHIKITKEVVEAIDNISSLEYVVIESGAGSRGKSTNESNLKLLKDLKVLSTFTLDGKTYIMKDGEFVAISEYTGECKDISIMLLKNAAKNIFEDEELFSFNPLEQCKLNSEGKVKEMYLVSSRNNYGTIEKAVSHDSISKLTYVIDDGFYQDKPATFGDIPDVINDLPNLKEFTLKYNYKVFDHGEYPLYETEINANRLKFTSKKLRTLTLEHIKITKEVINNISKNKYLKQLNVISANDADKTYYNNLKNLKNVSVTIDGKKVN